MRGEGGRDWREAGNSSDDGGDRGPCKNVPDTEIRNMWNINTELQS